MSRFVVRTGLIFALAFSNGCGLDSCEREDVEVEDDARLQELDFTAREVVAFVDGAHAFVGASDSLRAADATLDIARGEGSAILDDARFIRRYDADELDPFTDADDDDEDVKGECHDRLEVPVLARVVIAELNLDVTFDALAAPPMSNVLSEVWVSGSVPSTTATLPYPPDGAKTAVLTALFEGDELTRFRLYWGTGWSNAPDILEMNWFEE